MKLNKSMDFYWSLKNLLKRLRKKRECPICYESKYMQRFAYSVCGHGICNMCHTRLCTPFCPLCRANIMELNPRFIEYRRKVLAGEITIHNFL